MAMLNRGTILACLLCLTQAVMAQQTRSVNAGSGTLSFTLTQTQSNCELGPGRPTHDVFNFFSNFSYTDSSGTTALPDMSAQDETGPQGGSCILDPPENGTATTSAFSVTFVPSGISGTASVDYFSTGYINPKFVVIGLTYAPPGPSSNVQYTTVNFLSSTTTNSNTFNNANAITVSVKSGATLLKALGGTVTVSSTVSTSQAQTSTQGVTLSRYNLRNWRRVQSG